MPFLAGKRALIVGVASERSIAWGIAQALHREGAELASLYVNDKMKERVEPLARSLGCSVILPLDVTNDAEIGRRVRQNQEAAGATWISSSMQWPSPHARRSPAASSTPPAKPSASPMTCRATA